MKSPRPVAASVKRWVRVMETWRVSFSPGSFSYHRRAKTMRPLRLLALVAVLAVFMVLACAGTDVTVRGTDGTGATVQRTEDGTAAVVSGGGELPPVVV